MSAAQLSSQLSNQLSLGALRSNAHTTELPRILGGDCQQMPADMHFHDTGIRRYCLLCTVQVCVHAQIQRAYGRSQARMRCSCSARCRASAWTSSCRAAAQRTPTAKVRLFFGTYHPAAVARCAGHRKQDLQGCNSWQLASGSTPLFCRLHLALLLQTGRCVCRLLSPWSRPHHNQLRLPTLEGNTRTNRQTTCAI